MTTLRAHPTAVLPQPQHFADVATQRWNKAGRFLMAGLVLLPALLATRIGGLIDLNLWSVRVGQLGSVTVADIVLAILLAVGLRLRRRPVSHISQAVTLIVLLVAVQVVRNLLGGTDLTTVINGSRACVFYLSFFVIVRLLRDELALHGVLTWLLLIAAVEAVVTLLIYFGAIETSTVYIATIETQRWLSLPRIYPPSEYLIDLAFCVGMALWMSRERTPFSRMLISVSLVLMTGAVLVSLARSNYITTLVAAILISQESRKVITAKRIRLLVMAFVCVFGAWFLSSRIFGVGFEPFIEALTQTPGDLRQGTSSFNQRLDILWMKWEATTEFSPVLGRGFDWGDQSLYRSIEENPAARSNHNAIASVYVIFGAAGLMVFTWLFFSAFRVSNLLRRRAPSPTLKALGTGIRVFILVMLAKAWVTDPYTDATGIVTLGIAFGLLCGTERMLTISHQATSITQGPYRPSVLMAPQRAVVGRTFR